MTLRIFDANAKQLLVTGSGPQLMAALLTNVLVEFQLRTMYYQSMNTGVIDDTPDALRASVINDLSLNTPWNLLPVNFPSMHVDLPPYYIASGYVDTPIYWTLTALPTPDTSNIVYITSDSASSSQLQTAITSLSATGGAVMIDPAVTLSVVQNITSNPTNVVWIISGTAGSGRVVQTLPAMNYATNTRSTISAVNLATGMNNIKFHTVNVLDAAKYNNTVPLITGAGTCAAWFYNCELSGFPLGDQYYCTLLNAVSGAGFNVNDVVTGVTSGSIGTVLAKTTNELFLNTTTVGGTGFAVVVDNTVDTFTATAHGLVAGDIIRFTASVFPTGLAAATNYYVIASGLTADVFKVSLTAAGSSINMTTNGTSVVCVSCQSHPWFVGETLNVSAAPVSTIATLGNYNNTGLYGFLGTFNGGITIQGCYGHGMNNVIKPSSVLTSDFVINDNDFDLINCDSLFIGRSDANTPAHTRIHFNRTSRCIGLSTDYSNPHADSCQLAGTSTTARNTDWPNVEIFCNIVVNGLSRGVFQGTPFAEDMTAVTGGRHTQKSVGNILAVYDNIPSTVNFAVQRNLNCFFMGNYMVRGTPGSGSGVIVRTFKEPQGGTIDQYNTEELGGDYLSANKVYNVANTSASYAKVYAGAFPLTATNRADAIAELQAKVVPLSTGPLGYASTYIDWANKRIKLNLEPNKFIFTALIDQATSSTITAADWRKNWGLDASISISNGEYSIADDSAGTNASAYTSSSGTIASGKWLKVRNTSSGSAAIAVTTTITVGSTISTFTSITAAALSYTAIDNGNTTRSSASVGAVTFTKALIAFRVRRDSFTNPGHIFSDGGGGSYVKLTNPAAGTFRLYLKGSLASIDLTGLPTSFPDTMSTHIIAIDGTQGDGIAGGVTWVVNATVQALSAEVGWSAPMSMTLNASSLGLFNESDGGGTLLDGAMEFFYMDYGDATYQLPDITDPTVYAKFYKDLIGADGSGPTGLQPKFCWYGPLGASDGSTAESWNATAGLSSVGSNAAKMVKSGGNYA